VTSTALRLSRNQSLGAFSPASKTKDCARPAPPSLSRISPPGRPGFYTPTPRVHVRVKHFFQMLHNPLLMTSGLNGMGIWSPSFDTLWSEVAGLGSSFFPSWSTESRQSATSFNSMQLEAGSKTWRGDLFKAFFSKPFFKIFFVIIFILVICYLLSCND